jgi:DNA-binding transcriptional ArsR family regulator
MLRDGPKAVNDLAGHFPLGRPAISEHLQVLRRSGLVREEPRGRQRIYHLEPVPLAEVNDWLHPFERYWRERLRALRDVLDEENP